LVVPRPAAGSYVQDVMSINDLLDFADGTRFVIDSSVMVTVDDELAGRTGLAVREHWLAVRGYRQIEGADHPPCGVADSLTRAFAGSGRRLQRHEGPIFPLIEDMFGQNIIEVHQQITAVVIAPELATGLSVHAGTAALEVQRSYTTSDGEVAQV